MTPATKEQPIDRRGAGRRRGSDPTRGTDIPIPSDKTFARLLGRQSLNGWREWRAELLGGLAFLDDLQQSLSSPSDRDEQASA